MPLFQISLNVSVYIQHSTCCTTLSYLSALTILTPLLFYFKVAPKKRSDTMALMVLPLIGAVTVSESLVAVATVCLVYLVIRWFKTDIPEGLRPLPGPKALPFIGNVLQVGQKPYLSLTAMSERYGDVFQIQIGMRPVVVLSGLETVRQALVKQGEDFSGRPDLYSFRFINDGKSLAFSTDQAGVWRARRKLAYSALRTFSTLEGTTPEYSCMLEEHICKEGEYLVQQLNNVMKTEGSFDPLRHIVVSVANVICGMCFGRRYDHDDQELLNLVNLSDEFGTVTGSGNPADFIPILQYLPSPSMKKFLEINDRFNAFMKKIVTEHYTTYNKVNCTKSQRVWLHYTLAWLKLSHFPSTENFSIFFRTTFETSQILLLFTVRTGSWMKTPTSKCLTRRLWELSTICSEQVGLCEC